MSTIQKLLILCPVLVVIAFTGALFTSDTIRLVLVVVAAALSTVSMVSAIRLYQIAKRGE